jgi:protein O-GlcNAc transferase
MDQRLVAAENALKAGQRDAAIDLLLQVLTEEPRQTVQIYRVLLTQLYRSARYEEGELWAVRGVERFPKDFDLWNVRGVILRRLKRYPEALRAFDRAQASDPKSLAPVSNRGNVLVEMGDAIGAEKVFNQLIKKVPRSAEYQRELGRALRMQDKKEGALLRLRQAVALDPKFVDAWLDLAGLLNDLVRQTEAERVLDKAIEFNPRDRRLLEGKTLLIRRQGQLREAEAFLMSLLPELEGQAWVHHHLGGVISEYDRTRGNTHLRIGLALEPGNLDYLFALAESLDRTRHLDEAKNLEEAYALVHGAMESRLNPSQAKVANEILARICAFDDIERLGTFRDLGRAWARAGKHTALLAQLPRVRTPEDRFELVEQHRLWGEGVEPMVDRNPIRPPPPRPSSEKIRVGFMSSDLRNHPVGYFALPLFENIDSDRFEVFCYSYYQGQIDTTQEFITSKVTAYRWMQDISIRDAAQTIADDQLDILFELGGTTHMNRLAVMAYKPAPKQASWLGYPHSAGLSTIDYLVCDSYTAPPQAGLLLETPLIMPNAWIALGRRVFSDQHTIEATVPEARTGVITYGTANNPYKYGREMLRVWARVVQQTPGSRMLFIRPEGASAIFRQNIFAEFAAEGVAADRIEFRPNRGSHMPFYNEVDISLDTFPLTGGTTTCEALWMGVPVVSLVGEAYFERLSYSILSNAGLQDLCAFDVETFIKIAIDLAADRPRREALHATLREQIRNSPLGQTEQFARDFYALVARTVEGQPAAVAVA